MKRTRHFCQAKIENLRVAPLGDKYVGGFDIAVNDAFRVRRVQRIGNLNGQKSRVSRSATAGHQCGA